MKVSKKYPFNTNTNQKWKTNKKPYQSITKYKYNIKTYSNQTEYEYYYDTAKNEWGSKIISKTKTSQ